MPNAFVWRGAAVAAVPLLPPPPVVKKALLKNQGLFSNRHVVVKENTKKMSETTKYCSNEKQCS